MSTGGHRPPHARDGGRIRPVHRRRDRNASANLGAVRRLAVSLLKRVEPKKSLERKMFNAPMDLEFLKTILAGISAI